MGMRHTMRHTRLVLTVLSVTAALVATAAAGATPTAGSKLPPKLASGKVQIALVRQLGSGDFFQQWLTGAQKMAKLLKVKLLIYDARGKNEQMATDFQNAMNRGVDAIIVDHGLAETMNPLVDKAVKKGIPVVAFDLATPNKKVTQTQQSDILLGTMIATKMATDLRGKGKVGYVYVAGFAPLDRRNTAWQRVKKKYPGLEQVAQFGKVSDSTASDVQSQAAAVLTANPDLNAILAPYDEFAKGAVLAINQAGKHGGRDGGHRSRERGRGDRAGGRAEAPRHEAAEEHLDQAGADHAVVPSQEQHQDDGRSPAQAEGPEHERYRFGSLDAEDHLLGRGGCRRNAGTRDRADRLAARDREVLRGDSRPRRRHARPVPGRGVRDGRRERCWQVDADQGPLWRTPRPRGNDRNRGQGGPLRRAGRRSPARDRGGASADPRGRRPRALGGGESDARPARERG